MLFNSVAFLIFFPLVTLLYYLIPHRFRWILLLIASYYFYMSWDASLVVLILGTTAISYMAGLVIDTTSSKAVKKAAATIAVLGCLSVLFFFKYFNFLSSSVTNLLGAFGLNSDGIIIEILLPVGISFYTFQTLSYVIDIYRGRIRAERHFGYYALFVSFFPQLVAGPIERPEALMPQFKQNVTLRSENITIGLKYMVIGFFKKVVIADTVGIAVNAIYNNPSSASGLGVLIATVLFAIQILCDFDGYTNIAIGAAKLLGIDLMKNFDDPYSARSIKEFWSRWHISLSSWFKDYVYIPLGGNRCKKPRVLFNLFIVFLLSGLWHGANWTFVIWGAIHGVYRIVGVLTDKLRKKIRVKIKLEDSAILPLLQKIITFVLVCFAWLFFRANSISDCGILLNALFTDWSFSFSYIDGTLESMGLNGIMLAFIFVGVVLLFILSKRVRSLEAIRRLPDSVNVACSDTDLLIYVVLTVMVAVVWVYLSSLTGYSNSFIYFQF